MSEGIGTRRVRKGSNLPRVKEENLRVVLEALRKLQPISRSELAEATGLTAATITHLVDEVAALGLIAEVPADTRSVGRRPTLLSLDARRGQIVGVELSRTRVRGLRTDFGGGIQERLECAFDPSEGVEANLQQIAQVVRSLRDPDVPLLGLAMGIPGPVNTEFGVVLEPPNFGDWHQVAVTDFLTREFGVPAWLDDDAKTAALGERWFGAGRHAETLLYVSFRSGVGSGLVVGDRVFRGAHELAGEIGHATIDIDGPRCACGNHGCVETLVSVPAILAQARERGLDVTEVGEVHDLALAGNEVAARLRDRTYRYVSAALVNAVNHYDPALIVLGGTLVRAWPDFTAEVTTRVRGRSFGPLSKDVRIVPASLGPDASAMGAVSLAIENLLRHPARIAVAARAVSAG